MDTKDDIWLRYLSHAHLWLIRLKMYLIGQQKQHYASLCGTDFPSID